MGRRTGGRQQFKMKIDNNRSNGIRPRLRLDQALQPGKAQRDKVKNWYLPSMASLVSVAESTAILMAAYLGRSFFTLTINPSRGWSRELFRFLELCWKYSENHLKIVIRAKEYTRP